MVALFFRKRIDIKCAERLGVAMTTVCPICNPSAQELPPSGEATVHCPTHGDFKFADTIFCEDYTRKEWEAALDKAKQRAEPDEWPLIIVDDFY
jgi:hypothetical protein